MTIGRLPARRVLSIAACLLLFLPAIGHTDDYSARQVPSWVRVGAKLRVRNAHGDRPQVGSYARQTVDTLFLVEHAGGLEEGIPFSNITSIDVSREQLRRTGRSAGIGFLGGTAFGAVMGAASSSPGDKVAGAVIGGVVIGGISMFCGALGGHLTRGDEWEPVAEWAMENPRE